MATSNFIREMVGAWLRPGANFGVKHLGLYLAVVPSSKEERFTATNEGLSKLSEMLVTIGCHGAEVEAEMGQDHREDAFGLDIVDGEDQEHRPQVLERLCQNRSSIVN
ncbi:MAG TPA: hypothetical protein VHR47_08800 [Bacillota bacterium]|nr:hypothetical protein [Bacillota bacterium]